MTTEVQLAVIASDVLANISDANSPIDPITFIKSKLTTYQQATSYLTKVIADKQNHRIVDTELTFGRSFTICDQNGAVIAYFKYWPGTGWGLNYWVAVEGTDYYPAMRYMQTAVNNVIADIRSNL